jgi:hypothetical protein
MTPAVTVGLRSQKPGFCRSGLARDVVKIIKQLNPACTGQVAVADLMLHSISFDGHTFFKVIIYR